jgi:VWFA-related protein
MTSSRRLQRLAIVAAILAATGPARAGKAPQVQPPPFRAEANYVRVDVFPTMKGEPVTDLKQEDFDVLENGVAQKVDAFEHVVIRGAQPDAPRREPNTIAESRAMLDNPRARVFVLFLDYNHVGVGGSYNIRRPLINLLNRTIGPEDLVGVMTPEMSPADVTFARRMTTIEGLLSRYWFWGERDRLVPTDPREELYKMCYPGNGPSSSPGGCNDDDRGVADELIKRHKEDQTMNALEDLVVFLRGLREERKAILTITDGWLLYKPNPALSRRLNCAIPSAGIGIDPRNGRLATDTPRTISYNACETDRKRLALIDDDQRLRNIWSLANRANASFYPVDPRGLAVFDTSLGEPRTGLPAPGTTTIVPPSVDNQMLQARAGSLRDLAFETDGLAIVSTNNLEAGLQRVTADLSSYYLLGYYSNGKLDGKFHTITVRVKRPGVQVRARRGFLAPTQAELTSALKPGPPAMSAALAAAGTAIDLALAPLGGLGRDVPLRLRAVAGWSPAQSAAIAVVGEVGTGNEWKSGADADVMLTNTSGDTIATARAEVAAGSRGFRAMLTPDGPMTAGDYTIRVRARGKAVTPAAANEALRFTLPAAPRAEGAVFIRRGPTTGSRDVPTADLRFRRTEQIRVELPTASSGTITARLLDRNGNPMPIPVAAAVRDDADGSRWETAQFSLAPLGPGDYLIEVNEQERGAGSETTRTLLAFRIVP